MAKEKLLSYLAKKCDTVKNTESRHLVWLVQVGLTAIVIYSCKEQRTFSHGKRRHTEEKVIQG